MKTIIVTDDQLIQIQLALQERLGVVNERIVDYAGAATFVTVEEHAADVAELALIKEIMWSLANHAGAR